MNWCQARNSIFHVWEPQKEKFKWPVPQTIYFLRDIFIHNNSLELSAIGNGCVKIVSKWVGGPNNSFLWIITKTIFKFSFSLSPHCANLFSFPSFSRAPLLVRGRWIYLGKFAAITCVRNIFIGGQGGDYWGRRNASLLNSARGYFSCSKCVVLIIYLYVFPDMTLRLQKPDLFMVIGGGGEGNRGQKCFLIQQIYSTEDTRMNGFNSKERVDFFRTSLSSMWTKWKSVAELIKPSSDRDGGEFKWSGALHTMWNILILILAIQLRFKMGRWTSEIHRHVGLPFRRALID